MPKPTKQNALVRVGKHLPATPQPFNEKETAAFLLEAFEDTNRAFGQAIRKVAVCGLLMLDVKDRLPHGEFGPWLQKNCFATLSTEDFEAAWRKASRYMNTARGMAELLELDSVSNIDGRPLYLILQLEPCDLSKTQRDIQNQIFEFLEGKTQSQLQLAWKNAAAPRTGATKKDLSPSDAAEAVKFAAEERIKKIITDLELITDEERALISNALRDQFYDALVTETTALRELKSNKGRASRTREPGKGGKQ